MVDEAIPTAPETLPKVARGLGWRKYVLGLPLALLGLVAAVLIGLDTPIGHRVITDVLAASELDNGLRMAVGRIEGSIYSGARLEGVVLRDPQGTFLRAGEAELDWRPLHWFTSGLDIRTLAIKRGTLLRLPQLRPGDPNASIWPNFDIRVDRLSVEKLTIAPAILGTERRVDLTARLRLASGVAQIVVQGRFGGADRLAALFDADRAHNRFNLGLDYVAPKGGLLAALTGAAVDRHVRIAGKGSYTDWRGSLLAEQAGTRAAALRLTERNGHVGVAGQIYGDALFTAGLRRALGGTVVAVAGEGDVAGRSITGRFGAAASNLKLGAAGGVDLGQNRFDHLAVGLRGAAHLPLGGGDDFANLRAHFGFDGPFATTKLIFAATTDRWTSEDTKLEGLVAHGTAQRSAGHWQVPVQLQAARIVTADGAFDPQLHPVRAQGILTFQGARLTSDDVSFVIPHGTVHASLRGDVSRGAYALAGHAALRGWPLSVGAANADGSLVVTIARGQPWRVSTQMTGAVPQIANATLANVAGDDLHFSGHVEAGQGHLLIIAGAKIEAPLLTLGFAGARGADGRIVLSGQGEQRHYGSFSGSLSFGDNGPLGDLRFVDPLPAAGIKNVTVALTPEDGGALRIDTQGDSSLGPFSGALALTLPADVSKARLDVRRFDLSNTHVAGALALGNGGALGDLTLSGGGVSGVIGLAPRAGGQGVDVALVARDAHFAGDRPLTIATGQLKVTGLIQKHHTTLSADMTAQGVGKGRLFIGRLAMGARLFDGVGKVTASVGGRKGSRFDLAVTGDVAPDRVTLLAGGSFAGQRIAMPRRAVLTAELRSDGTTSGWRLAPSEIDFGGGRVLAKGVIGNGSLELGLGLADMPLSLADVVFADIGLGGKASGQFTYNQRREHLPEGEAHLMVKGLSRSGLLLTSRPVDVALVARLGTNALDLRAIASEGGATRGRLQARVDRLADTGMIADRLLEGHLVAQMRYGGPADALWRLMALDSFDLTGPIEIAADMGGTLNDPEIRGSLAGNTLRLQSAQAGTDITGITARGGFDGSALSLTSLAGHTGGNGQISGSGKVDFAGMQGGRGPSIDIMLAARRAQLISRPDMALTASGPIRILSDGVVGTIAGRLAIDGARWRLGQANAAAALPAIATKEINRRADIAPDSERRMPWRLLVDARGAGIRLQGLGLDSQWDADISLRGELLEPAIAGHADLLDGSYDFAGKHFDLTRGRISFDGNSPPDPRLDMAASASVNNITATVTVRGTSLKPEIAFSSVPALPEEELLARILFGDSITQISAPEALQLGAALAALHGGGGLDPINKLRTAIGLDRLRFVSADAALGRQTGVAVGKYLGRHFYAEIVSDGRGYSATNLEFRLTSWLALLGSVASTGRQSVNAKVSKDY